MNKKWLAVSLWALASLQGARAQDATTPIENVPEPAAGSGVVKNLAPAVDALPGKGEKIQLRLSFQKGQTFQARITTKEKAWVARRFGETPEQLRAEAAAQPDVIFDFGYTLRVLEVDPVGNTSVRITFNRANVDGAAPKWLTKAEFDVEKKAAQKTYKAYLGQSLIMKLSPQGKLLGMPGVDALVNHLIAATKLARFQGRPMMPESMRQDLKASLSDGGDNDFSRTFALFPAHAVAVGDSWTSSTSTPSDDASADVSESTYHLKSRSNRVALLESTSVFKGSRSGTQIRTTRIDEATGFPLSGDIHSEGSSSGSYKIDDTHFTMTPYAYVPPQSAAPGTTKSQP